MSVLCAWTDGSPHEDDPRKEFEQYGRQWETDMMHAGCNNCPGCTLAMVFPCCFAYHLRTKALQGDMSRYACCQGYFCPQYCDTCNNSAKDCPECCLCIEVTVCESCAISSTRMYVQEERQITTDPCDNRLIRFNNCMQIMACVIHLLAIFIKELRELAVICDYMADIIYCLTQAAMQAQTHHELNLHPTAADYGSQTMVGTTVVQPYGNTDKQPLMQQAPPGYSEQ